MAYDGTVFTAIKLDDKDVNDPNSGFYTAQATTNQINSIPTDAKEAGELLYNKTTGKLVLYNGIAGGWETVNSSAGFVPNATIALTGSNSIATSVSTLGESYMPLDTVNILKNQNFTVPNTAVNTIKYIGSESIIVNYAVTVSISCTVVPDSPHNNVKFYLYRNNNKIITSNGAVEIYGLVANNHYYVSLTNVTNLVTNDTLSCKIASENLASPQISYTLDFTQVLVTTI